MSKHFELMQQMEREQAGVVEPTAAGVAELPAAFVPRSHARVVGTAQNRWASDEALRLVQQIFLLQTQEPPRVVVFAGIDHGNGCSYICASVAETLAKTAGARVCLVEGNFRSPALPEMYGTTNHHGLAEALLQRGPIDSFTRPTDQEGLWLLSSGTLAIDSPSLLSSEFLRERLAELRADFDFVIIDAPPLTRYSDAVVLGQHSDGVVMVLEAESTRRKSASVVAANLRSVGVSILAAVLNKRTFPIPEKIYNRL